MRFFSVSYFFLLHFVLRTLVLCPEYLSYLFYSRSFSFLEHLICVQRFTYIIHLIFTASCEIRTLSGLDMWGDEVSCLNLWLQVTRPVSREPWPQVHAPPVVQVADMMVCELPAQNYPGCLLRCRFLGTIPSPLHKNLFELWEGPTVYI